MTLISQKKRIFGEIAALRVSIEGYPKKIKNFTKSLSPINKGSLNYLIELLKSLVGFEGLKNVIVETLTNNLDNIENEIKLTIKESLKGIINCGINPTIPQWAIDDGVSININSVDFSNILKINPTSSGGKLLYNDINSKIESTDFNTYLYYTMQKNGESTFWGHNTSKSDILEFKFNSSGDTESGINNIINSKVLSTYSTNNKLTDLNNDYVDSIVLLDPQKIINNIIDSMFGSISFETKKDKQSIEQSVSINKIINKIINSDENDIIDNSYFSFTNEEISAIKNESNLLSKGHRLLETSKKIRSTIPLNSLSNLNSSLEALANDNNNGKLNEDIINVVRKGIDGMASDSAKNSDKKDKTNIKINFFENMIHNLMTSIINIVISPKLITIFAINHKIIYNEDFTSIEDFMKKNKVLISAILKTVRNEIVEILLAKVLKEIKIIIIKNFEKIEREKILTIKAQLASLSGVSNDLLRKISGITKT